MNFTLKIIKENRTIQRVQTHSIRRFLNNLRAINWQNGPLKGYLRVSYGRQKNCFGRMVNFYNDGWYDNDKDLWLSFNTFKEE